MVPGGIMRGHNRVNISTFASMRKVFENLFKKPLNQISSNYLQGDLMQNQVDTVVKVMVLEQLGPQ
jgi:hypothetical protein